MSDFIWEFKSGFVSWRRSGETKVRLYLGV